jgi:hypothetical protein
MHTLGRWLQPYSGRFPRWASCLRDTFSIARQAVKLARGHEDTFPLIHFRESISAIEVGGRIAVEAFHDAHDTAGMAR